MTYRSSALRLLVPALLTLSLGGCENPSEPSARAPYEPPSDEETERGLHEGCPTWIPTSGDACWTDELCTWGSVRFDACGEVAAPTEALCVDDRWQIRQPIGCFAGLPQGSPCDVPGRFRIATTSPYDIPVAEQMAGPFELAFELRDDGSIYVEADSAFQFPGECRFHIVQRVARLCEDDGIDCNDIHRFLEIDLSTAPGTGRVRLQDEQGGDPASAPVEAERLP